MPPLALDLRSAVLALAGTASALPISVGFWLLAGQLARLPWTQRLTLGGVSAALAGCLGAGLRAQVRWPLDEHPPRCTARQLVLAYGVGGGLTVAAGALAVGAVVLPLGWGRAAPDVSTLLSGATSGFVGAAFAVPPAMLVGALVGEVLGRLVSYWPPSVAAWAAALAWWLAGSAGGAVVGAFVAGQTGLSLSTGVSLGALLQSAFQVLLFPLAAYLVRQTFVLLA